MSSCAAPLACFFLGGIQRRKRGGPSTLTHACSACVRLTVNVSRQNVLYIPLECQNHQRQLLCVCKRRLILQGALCDIPLARKTCCLVCFHALCNIQAGCLNCVEDLKGPNPLSRCTHTASTLPHLSHLNSMVRSSTPAFFCQGLKACTSGFQLVDTS